MADTTTTELAELERRMCELISDEGGVWLQLRKLLNRRDALIADDSADYVHIIKQRERGR